ncbi:MAG: CAP domain-containing protein [Candidatus Metalachnospira sp.]|nr:CAP domain-containing protein [Candidatus Metalachnospira sp.]
MKRKAITVLTAAILVMSSTPVLAATSNCSTVLSNLSDFSCNSVVESCNNYLTNLKSNSSCSNSKFVISSNGSIADLSSYLKSCGFNVTTDYTSTDSNASDTTDCTGPDCNATDTTEVVNNDTDTEEVVNNDTDTEEVVNDSSNSTAAVAESQYISEVIRLVNVERAKEGLSALTTNSTIQAAAQVRAQEIVTSFAHTRPNGSSCFTALDQGGVKYSGAGENIAYGQPTPAAVVDAWMNSPGHRANIMNASFTTIGVGCYKSGSTYYWSQFFTY